MNTKPTLSINCGPVNDIRTLTLELPILHPKIGVLVSGGLDSALLYYLVRSTADERHTVSPYTIMRNDGSINHAQNVIDYVNKVLNKESQLTEFIRINETNNELQVMAGLKALQFKSHIYFVGLIETLPEHAIGVPKPFTPVDGYRVRFPMKNLNKSHIVDLVQKLYISELFEITHSCVYPNGRCNICNRCNERRWAFEQLGSLDPGVN